MRNYLAACVTFAVGLTGATEEAQADKEQARLDVTLQKGDFVFIGMEDGVKNKSEIDAGVEPVVKLAFVDASREAELTLRIHVDLRPVGTDKEPWLMRAEALRGDAAKGDHLFKTTWKDSVKPDETGAAPAVAKLKPELKKEDVDAAGVSFWRIPYATVRGDTRCVLIVKARSLEEIKKLVRIPKTCVSFKWERAIELK
jgi:hypothetical protein